MKNYAILGTPVAHSFSPKYFATKFVDHDIQDCRYFAKEMKTLDDLQEWVQEDNMAGFNVTMPHKQNIIHQLHGISYSASAINAVNTVKVVGGKLVGYNTDIVGFRNSITPLLTAIHTKALIFGTGGSSAAVRFVLRELGIAYKSVSRSAGADYTYTQLTKEIITEFTILINTTPLGMKDLQNKAVDIPYYGISPNHLCYDLIYTPAKTMFLKKAKMQGAKIKNGLQMLEIQADKSWEIWNM